MKLGVHVLKTQSTTQGVIALLSSAAEYYALVKTVSQGVGMRSMLADFGVEPK